jgi:hypothetical protein
MPYGIVDERRFFHVSRNGEGGKGKKHCAVNVLCRPVQKHCDGREETFQRSTRRERD